MPNAKPSPNRHVVITALGIVQIFAWGTSFYFPAVFAAPIVAETGWPLEWVVGGTSLGSSTELQRRMVEDAIGRRVEITVWHNGELVDVLAVPRELTESAS